jgi:hypothetical protein
VAVESIPDIDTADLQLKRKFSFSHFRENFFRFRENLVLNEN